MSVTCSKNIVIHFFSCIEFRINNPVTMTDFHSADGRIKGGTYVAGIREGITLLKILS